MARVGPHRTSWIVVLATGLVLFHSWVLFAERVIDRYEWWRFLRLRTRGRGRHCRLALSRCALGPIQGANRQCLSSDRPAFLLFCVPNVDGLSEKRE